MQRLMITVGKLVVVFASLSILTSGLSAREHILLSHIDHGKSTVISDASQATEGIVGGLRTNDVSAVTQHFSTLNGIVVALAKELPTQSTAIRTEAPEVLSIVLTNLRDTLVRHSSLWSVDARWNALCSGELKKIGDIAGSMLIAGLRDSDAQAKAHSVLAIGVLVGGQSNFQQVAFSPGRGGFQNLFEITPVRLNQMHQELASLQGNMKWIEVIAKDNREMMKWIEVLAAISDKVHEMIP